MRVGGILLLTLAVPIHAAIPYMPATTHMTQHVPVGKAFTTLIEEGCIKTTYAMDASAKWKYERISNETIIITGATFKITCENWVNEVPSAPRIATLSWTAPTEWTDNTPLNLAQLSGYVVYYYLENSPEDITAIHIDDPSISKYVTKELPIGKYSFNIAAVAVGGVMSENSVTVSKEIR